MQRERGKEREREREREGEREKERKRERERDLIYWIVCNLFQNWTKVIKMIIFNYTVYNKTSL